jgi:hypothetical protein
MAKKRFFHEQRPALHMRGNEVVAEGDVVVAEFWRERDGTTWVETPGESGELLEFTNLSAATLWLMKHAATLRDNAVQILAGVRA